MADPTPIELRGYAHPEVLVSTFWLPNHLNDPRIKISESDEDVLLYDTGHVPGAQKLDWIEDLNDKLTRDHLDRDRLQELLRRKGVNEGDMIVLYGDKNNWWATYALWVLGLFGIHNLKIMYGGRARWTRTRTSSSRRQSCESST